MDIHYATDQIYQIFILFVRLGCAFAALPGFSANWVPMRVRLLLAGAVTLLVVPSLGAQVPPMPASPLGLGLLIAGEAVTGVFIGTLARIAFAGLQAAGTMVAFFSSFANALVQDPVVDQQSSTISGLFTTLGLVLVFATDLHHLMLRGIIDSYAVFAIGAAPMAGDFAEAATRALAAAFALGLQLAAPFLVVSLTVNIGIGLLGRLMPQLQVFFFSTPIQLALHIWVLMLTISGIMLAFLRSFPGAIQLP